MSIKIRTRTENGLTTVGVIIRHSMETGRRQDPQTKRILPIHHIREVSCKVNDELVMSAYVGTGISTNPFFSFHIEDTRPGDVLALTWLDNLGNSDTINTAIK
ncbi:MAG: thiosulfate oxidation carrier complex protein SoxZ [Gammaproteobacteria bacterium]